MFLIIKVTFLKIWQSIYLFKVKKEISEKNKNTFIPDEDDLFIQKITNKFNDSIVFEPHIHRMSYTIRDPIINSRFKIIYRTNGIFEKFIKNFIKEIFVNETNRGFAQK